MTRDDEEYQLRMSVLTKKVSAALDGEKLLDAASACAMCCAFAIAEETGDEAARAKMLDQLVKFMTRIIARYDNDVRLMMH